MNEETLMQLVGLAVAVAAPVITALVTSAEARAAIKVGVCLVISAVAGGITAWGQYDGATDWVTLALAGFGVAQLAYCAADSAFERYNGAGLNEQGWARPTSGLG